MIPRQPRNKRTDPRVPDPTLYGSRVESGVEEGGEVIPFDDPMMAKLIVAAPNRRAAAARLAQACRKVEVWPVRTNAAFLARALDDPDFLAGSIDTGLIEAHQDALIPPDDAPEAVLTAAPRALMTAAPAPPWGGLSRFRQRQSVESGTRVP